jgi:hypothetical protein
MWRELGRLLARYPSAIVTFVGDDGYPISFRCRPRADDAARILVIDPPAGVRPRPGRAGLLCHRHNDELWKLRSFHAAGVLEARDGRWVLAPDRLTIGMGHGGPVAQLRMVRRGQRTAAAYLARRGWERPPIDWHRFDRIKREVFG